MEWQPISTAPKDGTEVIVAAQNGCVGQAEFQDGSWWWAGWYEESWAIPIEKENGSVTHWMPLPAPPPKTEEVA